MPSSKAPKIDFAVTDEQLTGSAGLALVANLAGGLDLPCQLAQRVRLKRRQRGCSDEQMLLSLIYCFCAGGGHLSDVDSLQSDPAHADGQRLLVPRYGFIVVSWDDLPLAELVRRHRAKQGQENSFKGPLRELNLHHPPCKSGSLGTRGWSAKAGGALQCGPLLAASVSGLRIARRGSNVPHSAASRDT